MVWNFAHGYTAEESLQRFKMVPESLRRRQTGGCFLLGDVAADRAKPH